MSKLVTEQFTYNGETILELNSEYIPDSVNSYTLSRGFKKTLDVSEVGGKFIDIATENVELNRGDSIAVIYKVEEDSSKFSELQRIKNLETIVEKLQKENAALAEALKYRVDLKVFKSYLKNLEKELGLDLIDQTFPLPYP